MKNEYMKIKISFGGNQIKMLLHGLLVKAYYGCLRAKRNFGGLRNKVSQEVSIELTAPKLKPKLQEALISF